MSVAFKRVLSGRLKGVRQTDQGKTRQSRARRWTAAARGADLSAVTSRDPSRDFALKRQRRTEARGESCKFLCRDDPELGSGRGERLVPETRVGRGGRQPGWLLLCVAAVAGSPLLPPGGMKLL